MRGWALLIALLPLTLTSQGMAAQHGRWTNDTAHGYERYWTENRSGSARFTIWCAPNQGIRGGLIGIDIEGFRPSPESLVRIELDHQLVKFTAGHDGFIRIDCPLCADNMTYFWHRLRSAGKLLVLLEDKRFAAFSLKGVQDATPRSICASQSVSR